MKLINRFVRWATKWAWKHELSVTEGIAVLKSFNMEDDKLEFSLKQDPTIAQWIAKCFVSMVANSPNYTEMKFDLADKYNGKHEWITVHIQKGNGKTPHQLRKEAEEERDKLICILATQGQPDTTTT